MGGVEASSSQEAYRPVRRAMRRKQVGPLHTGPRGLRQRYRGHADSWAASTLARFGGMLMLALLLLTAFAPSGASASTHGSSPDPSPQKAPPAPSSTTPAPDPTPQATVKSQPSYSAPPATQSAPTSVIPRTVPTGVTPEGLSRRSPNDAVGVAAELEVGAPRDGAPSPGQCDGAGTAPARAGLPSAGAAATRGAGAGEQAATYRDVAPACIADRRAVRASARRAARR